MKPAPFRYVAPDRVEQALELLAQNGADAKILAGGQSLVPLLNMRLASPAMLIDIRRLDGLSSIRREDGRSEIGALVRQRVLEMGQSDYVHPLLARAVEYVGHPATRSRGTIVGSICHGEPSGELPVCAVALEAEIVAVSTKGTRRIPAAEFYKGYFTTTLADDELATEVSFPVSSPAQGLAFAEKARRLGDFALVCVACCVSLARSGKLERFRLALGGVGDTPVLSSASDLAIGQHPSRALYEQIAEFVVREIEPPRDLHASAEYRRILAKSLSMKAIGEAVRNAVEGRGHAE